MNNIEMEAIKRGLRKYFNFDEEKINRIHSMNEVKLSQLKTNMQKLENDEQKAKNENIRRKLEKIFARNPKLTKQRILGNGIGGNLAKGDPLKLKKPKKGSNIGIPLRHKQEKLKPLSVDPNRKPKILFMTDVKGWAWWIKSEYIKKYLSDEFDIDIKNLLEDNGAKLYHTINKQGYDLYFSYGFSYIDFLRGVPKNKKVCGVTAHRAKNVIFPKMKMARYHHANSMMLLKELQDMGFERAYYVPNGVNEELFKPIKPIRKEGDLIVGHVGKECPAKGQREFILPAIQATGCKSATNLRTYKDKLPHNEMPKIYNDMDVFMVASVEDGTPNPALEAAACGRPIISNQIGNMPEFIKDGWNGFIVPRKLSAYIDKINYFKKNRSELIRMGNNARKTVEEGWTWRLQSENYRKMFHDIFGMNKNATL
jgi:glycosyltransferase involved in cell wall biosynthesis